MADSQDLWSAARRGERMDLSSLNFSEEEEKEVEDFVLVEMSEID